MSGTGGDGAPDGTEDSGAQVVVPDFARRRFRQRLRAWRPLLLAGLAVVLVGTGVWLLYFSSVLTVRTVEVEGQARVTVAQVLRAAEVPAGEQLIAVNLEAVAERIKAQLPGVRTVEVGRSWPHDITITITERVPIAVLGEKTSTRVIDAEGKPFPRKKALDKGLPLMVVPPDVTREALAEGARVVTALRADIAARVEQIDVATVDEIGLRLTGGITVQWGSAEESENKAEVLAVLLQQKKKVSEIDVSVPGRPTTR